MFVTGRCKECNGVAVFDLGDLSIEEAKEKLSSTDFGHCQVGWHVELGSMSDYYMMNWDVIFQEQDKAQDYVSNLKKRRSEYANSY